MKAQLSRVSICSVSGQASAPVICHREKRGDSVSSSNQTACTPAGGSTPMSCPHLPGLDLWAGLQVHMHIDSIVLLSTNQYCWPESPFGCGLPIHTRLHRAVRPKKPSLSLELLKWLARCCSHHVTYANTNGFWHLPHRVQRCRETECLSDRTDCIRVY